MSAENVIPFEKPNASIINVDPATAKRWLGKNFRNRNFRQKVANAYAADMAHGRWHLTGAPIQFGRDGRLLDGQHRLAAVIQSGCTIAFFVVRGIDEEAQSVMDTGAKRLTSDALGLQGYARQHLLAAATRVIILIEDGRIYKDTRVQTVTTPEIMDWIDLNPEITDHVATVDVLRRKIDCAPTAIAAAMWITNKVDRAESAKFWTQLASRADVPDGSPIHAIDSRLRELRRHRTTPSYRDLVSMFIRGWNAWRRGATLRTIPLASRDGRIPPAR